MKYLLPGLLILLSSCKHDLKSGNAGNPAGPVWRIADSMAYVYKYLPSGLPDSSIMTYYYFYDGEPNVVSNELTTRAYDATGKLAEEQTFTHNKKSNKWILDSKTIKKYDAKGNIILSVDLDIKKSRSIMSQMTKFEYNQKNQEIHRMAIRKDLEDQLNWNLDSAKAHLDDIKTPKYDTSVISSFYDGDGNLVKEIDGNPENPSREVLYTTYDRGIKKADNAINPKGDTIEIHRYEKEGDLLRRTIAFRTPSFGGPIDTVWYRGNKEVKRVEIDDKMHMRMMYLYGYDEKGNEIYKSRYR